MDTEASVPASWQPPSASPTTRSASCSSHHASLLRFFVKDVTSPGSSPYPTPHLQAGPLLLLCTHMAPRSPHPALITRHPEGLFAGLSAPRTRHPGGQTCAWVISTSLAWHWVCTQWALPVFVRWRAAEVSLPWPGRTGGRAGYPQGGRRPGPWEAGDAAGGLPGGGPWSWTQPGSSDQRMGGRGTGWRPWAWQALLDRRVWSQGWPVGAERVRAPMVWGKHENLGCQYQGVPRGHFLGAFPLLHLCLWPRKGEGFPRVTQWVGGRAGAETGTFQGTLQARVGVPFRVREAALQAAAPRPPKFPVPSRPSDAVSSPPLQVNLVLGDGRSLGLTIRGGAEYGLGIYVTGVDPGSEAESSGLKVRDPWLQGEGWGAGLQAWERGREGSYVWNSGQLIAMGCPAERSAPRLKDLSQPGALPWLHDSPSQLTAHNTSTPHSQASSSPSDRPTGHPPTRWGQRASLSSLRLLFCKHRRWPWLWGLLWRLEREEERQLWAGMGLHWAASGLAFNPGQPASYLSSWRGPAACPTLVLNVTHIISLNIILPCGVRCSYPHCPVGETEAVEVKQTCPRSCSGWRAEQGLSPAALAPKPMGLTATLYPPLGRAGNCPRALGEVQWVRWRLCYTGPPPTPGHRSLR